MWFEQAVFVYLGIHMCICNNNEMKRGHKFERQQGWGREHGRGMREGGEEKIM